MDEIGIRAVHDHEWREVRDLRLRALSDSAADIAFLDTLDSASTQPDEFWQRRTLAASDEAGDHATVRQFVATTATGGWIGSVTVLIERAGEKDFHGAEITRSAGLIVGVYLDPPFRGRGIIQNLLEVAVDWVRERGLEVVLLHVHTENLRARGAYAKAGFSATGITFTGSIGPELEMARRV